MFTLKDAAKYSIKPHQLGFCGPDCDCTEVLKNGTNEQIKSTLKKFPAVYHYCEMIAKANGIDNPLDERILEAYWIGNDLLEKAKMENGKYPHHSYHVWQAKPFNPEIKLDDKLKQICQITVRKEKGKYFTYHWNEKIQEINEEQKNNLEKYNKINKNGEE